MGKVSVLFVSSLAVQSFALVNRCLSLNIKWASQNQAFKAIYPIQFINFKLVLFDIIKPFIWKKKEEKFFMLIMQLRHLKHFWGCQLLGPSTLTATNKNVLVLDIFNLESRVAWCSAASICSGSPKFKGSVNKEFSPHTTSFSMLVGAQSVPWDVSRLFLWSWCARPGSNSSLWEAPCCMHRKLQLQTEIFHPVSNPYLGWQLKAMKLAWVGKMHFTPVR